MILALGFNPGHAHLGISRICIDNIHITNEHDAIRNESWTSNHSPLQPVTFCDIDPARRPQPWKGFVGVARSIMKRAFLFGVSGSASRRTTSSFSTLEGSGALWAWRSPVNLLPGDAQQTIVRSMTHSSLLRPSAMPRFDIAVDAGLRTRASTCHRTPDDAVISLFATSVDPGLRTSVSTRGSTRCPPPRNQK